MNLARGVMVISKTNTSISTEEGAFEHWPAVVYKSTHGDVVKNTLGHVVMTYEGAMLPRNHVVHDQTARRRVDGLFADQDEGHGCFSLWCLETVTVAVPRVGVNDFEFVVCFFAEGKRARGF
jgi:hypothetical protein